MKEGYQWEDQVENKGRNELLKSNIAKERSGIANKERKTSYGQIALGITVVGAISNFEL